MGSARGCSYGVYTVMRERERERERERTLQVQILTMPGFASEVSVTNTSQYSSFKLLLALPSAFSLFETSC
jgi:hypothetical protein